MKQRLLQQQDTTRWLKPLLVLLALIIMPMGTWAQDYSEDYSKRITVDSRDEPVWIFDTNANDILGDGTMSYDPINNVLTLDHVDLSCTQTDVSFLTCSDWDNIINSPKIRLIGENTITLGSNASFFDGYAITFMTGEGNAGSLKINKQSGWSGKLFKDDYQEITPTYEDGLTYNTSSSEIDLDEGYYSLWVCGTQVTDANKDDILGDGKWSYEHYSGGWLVMELTLHGVSVENYNGNAISTGSRLTVKIEQGSNNTISCADGYYPFYSENESLIYFDAYLDGTITGTNRKPFSYNCDYCFETHNVTQGPTLYFTQNGYTIAPGTNQWDVRINGSYLYDENHADVFGDGSVSVAESDNGNTVNITLNNANFRGPITTEEYENVVVDLTGVNYIRVIDSPDIRAFHRSYDGSYNVTFTGNGELRIIDKYITSADDPFTSHEYSSTNTYDASANFTTGGWLKQYVTPNDGSAPYLRIYKPVTNYDITVAGIEVTSQNASNIKGDGITAGKVSFNPESNTLTLDGATLASGITTSSIYSLTVELVGTNTIESGEYAFSSTYQDGNALLYFSVEGDKSAMLLTNVESEAAFANGFLPVSNSNKLPTGYALSFDAYNHYSIAKYLNVEHAFYKSINNVDTEVYQPITEANYDKVASEMDKSQQMQITASYNPTTHVVTLNGYDNIVWGHYGAPYSFKAESVIDNLTIHLLGTNTVTTREDGGFFSGNGLTFTTDENNPGTLTITRELADNAIALLEIANNGTPVCKNGLQWVANDVDKKYYVKQAPTVYDLSVAGVTVTSANATNITGENITEGKVSFDHDTNTLTLDHATIDMRNEVKGAVVSTLPDLNVYLKGINTIMVNADDPYPFTAVGLAAQGSLAFVTDEDPDGTNKLIVVGISSTNTLASGYGVTNDLTEHNNTSSIPVSESNEIGAVEDGWYSYTSDNTVHVWYFKSYDLWISANRITTDYMNADLNAVQPYQPATHTLPVNQYMPFYIKSCLPELNIEVAGMECYIAPTVQDRAAIFFEVSEWGPETGTLTIKASDKGNAHKLVLSAGAGAISGFSEVNIAQPLAVTAPDTAPTEWDNTCTYAVIGDYDTNYGIAIYNGDETTYITDVNNDDVLGDGTISFSPDSYRLILNNANFGNASNALTCSLPELTVELEGNSTVTADDVFFVMSYYGQQQERATLKFTTDENNPGSLTFAHNDGSKIYNTDNIFDYVNPEYDNGLASTKLDNNYYIGSFEQYDLWVLGEQVNIFNRDNVLYNETKSVRYDAATSTLTLKNADLDCEGVSIPIDSKLPNLTVYLDGSNTITHYPDYPVFSGTETATTPTLAFATSDTDPGKLVIITNYDNYVQGFEDPVTYNNGLQLTWSAEQDSYRRVISINPTGYGLYVGDTEVTNVNCDDVLGTRKSGNIVTFDAATSTLKFLADNDYSYEAPFDIDGNVVLASASSLTSLNVQLQGETHLSGKIISQKESVTPTLAFCMNPNMPGTLTFMGKTSAGDIQSGFAFDPDNGGLLNGLKQGLVNEGQDWRISNFIPIHPIMNEDKSTTYVKMYYWDYHKLLNNTVVDNLLFTLPNNEGFESDGDYSSIGGVVISTNMTDEEAIAAVNAGYPVGSDEYAAAFHGITLMVPAGEGSVTLNVKSNGSRFKVIVGDNAPYEPEGQPYSSTDYQEMTIPYSCVEPIFIRIYMLNEGLTSRGTGPIREKVQHATVKVSGYSGHCSMVISGGEASIYSNAADYGSASAGSFSMSNVSMVGRFARSTSPMLREASANVYPIVEIGPKAFDDFDGIESLRYLDLTGTQIRGAVVNRKLGTFHDISEHTLICLPNGNDDGNEPNVMTGDKVKSMVLNENIPFRSPAIEFLAEKVSLKRTFTPGKTSTIFLPFTIPASQAASMGAFYRFKEIKGSDAVFYDAETGDIAANTPYIFVPTASQIEANSVNVKGTNTTFASNGNLTGTYERIEWTTDQTDIFGFAAQDDGDVKQGQFVLVGAGAWLPPFRAYLKVANSSSARLRVVIDGDTDSITTVGLGHTAPGAWYTLDGQKLSGTPTAKGIYINNGKKIIVR